MSRPSKASRLTLLTVVAVIVALLPFASSARGATGPLPQDDSAVTDEDTPVEIDVLANDTGPLDASTLEANFAIYGSVQVLPASHTVRYSPEPHYSGPAQFRYTVCDAASQCASATVYVTVVFFGPYRLVGSHPDLSVAGSGTDTGGLLQLQLPDGSGPAERFHNEETPYGLQSAISPDGEWLAFNSSGGITLHSLIHPDQRVSFGMSQPSQPSWSPDGATFVVESAGALWRFTRPPKQETPGDPIELVDPARFTYQVQDEAGLAVKVPVLGSNPSWGEHGVAFENWSEYVDPNPDHNVWHTGIAKVDYASRPEVFMNGYFRNPDWSSDNKLVVGCPQGLCIMPPTVAGTYTMVNPIPGNLQLGTSDDVRWSPDASKIAFGNRVVNADGSGLTWMNKRDNTTRYLSWDPRPYSPPAAPWTRSGQLAYQRNASSGPYGVLATKADTSEARLIAPASTDPNVTTLPSRPAWSPDGRRVALLLDDPFSSAYELAVMDPDGTNKLRLAGVVESEIAWSPDGAEIVFTSGAYPPGFFAIHPDGSGRRRISDVGVHFPSFSPDGRFIVFQSGLDGTDARIYYLRADGTTNPAPVQGMPNTGAWHPSVSRDGHLAYVSNFIQVADVLWDVNPVAHNLRPVTFPDHVEDGLFVQTSSEPTWSPDSMSIAYTRIDDTESRRNFPRLYMVNIDGSRDAMIAASTVGLLSQPNWGAEVIPPPTITSVAPASGPVSGGSAVTITGADFGGPGTSVSFGGVAATVTGGSATSMTVATPAHSATVVDVVVTNPDAQAATAVSAFTYVVDPPPPTPGPRVWSIKPNRGPRAGGTLVTIAGNYFGGPGTRVLFGGVAAQVRRGSATSLTVTTPRHARGAVAVVVINPDGQRIRKPAAYTYT